MNNTDISSDQKPIVRLHTPEIEIQLWFSKDTEMTDFIAQFCHAVHDVTTPLRKMVRDAALTRQQSNGSLIIPGHNEYRKGVYTYSDKNQLYTKCIYDGAWLNGKPHGSGTMTWPDATKHIGRFSNGLRHGYADKREFRGYVKDSLRHGHGVMDHRNWMSYFGNYENNLRSGYGVYTKQSKLKYFGFWKLDRFHGRGVLVTLDDLFYEGLFEDNRLVSGTLVYPDGTRYDGEFQDVDHFRGKGILRYPNGESISGTFAGSVHCGAEVAITNATLTMTSHQMILKKESVHWSAFDMESRLGSTGAAGDGVYLRPRDGSDLRQSWELFPLQLREEHQCLVPAYLKWTSLFNHFYADLDLVVDKTNARGIVDQSGRNSSEKLRNAFVVFEDRVKRGDMHDGDDLCEESISLEVNQSSTEELESCRQSEMPSKLIKVVRRKWSDMLRSPHPINRLVNGICGILSDSYCDIGWHRLLLSDAVNDINSVVERIYSVIRILYPNLPTILERTKIPRDTNADNETPDDDCQTLGAFCYSEKSMPESPCQMIYDAVVSRIYNSGLMTLFVFQLRQYDEEYTRIMKVQHLAPLSHFLTFIEMNQEMRSFLLKKPDDYTERELQAMDHIDKAKQSLTEIVTQFCPSSKLSKIRQCLKYIHEFLHTGLGAYTCGADDLVPVTQFVIRQAHIHNLGAELAFIHTFCGDDNSGVLAYMLCNFEHAYQQIISKNNSMV